MALLIRLVITACALAFMVWVGLGVYRAGGDVPAPISDPQTHLTAGHAEGRRVDGAPSWSLDYDRVTASADTTLATLENVRHGKIYRRGRPFMQMQARHVVVNTLTNDFTVTGPLQLLQNDGKHQRRLSSDSAAYSGLMQTLTLNHPADIVSDGAKLKVATATINFRSGDMALGRIIGIY